MTNNEYLKTLLPAKEVTTVTLVGYFIDSFPSPRGNCFSLATDTDNYRIVNFNYENLEHLLETKQIEFPIDILPLSNKVAVISDVRIPPEYYSDKFCETCTPLNLLPMPQRLKQIRDIQSGKRTETETEFGTMISIKF